MDFFGFLQAIKNTLRFAALREVYCAAPRTIIPSTFSIAQGVLFLHTNTTFEFFLLLESIVKKCTYVTFGKSLLTTYTVHWIATTTTTLTQ